MQTEGANIESIADSIAADLGVGYEPEDTSTVDDAIDAADVEPSEPVTEPQDTTDTRPRGPDGKFAKADAPDTTEPPADTQITDPVTDLPVPKSWAKEMHPIWDKLAKGVPLNAEESRKAATYYNEREKQMASGVEGYRSDAEYGRSLRQVFNQHADVLQQQGLDATRAASYLLNAHRMLSMGSQEQRQAYLARVAQTYGLELPQAQPADPNAPAAPQATVPPELMSRLDRLEQEREAERQAQYQQMQEKTAAEVNAFAADPKNVYFDECADHIVMLLKSDPKLTLADAYQTAVWANPVTRAKEIARIETDKLTAERKRIAEEAKNAKKATSANVRGRDTQRTPQAPRATVDQMDEVLNETLADIRSRG